MDAEIVPSGLGEEKRDGESPRRTVARLARAKGMHVVDTLGDADGATVVLAADTAVVLGSTILGKPETGTEAVEMLRLLSGRTHEVYTGIHLHRTDLPADASTVEVTRVRFRELDEATIRWYVDTGEPLDKAGAYGIQGRGVFLTSHIEGSWSNVVGLPLERLPGLFREIGLSLGPRPTS
jgi:septum formation protein